RNRAAGGIAGADHQCDLAAHRVVRTLVCTRIRTIRAVGAWHALSPRIQYALRSTRHSRAAGAGRIMTKFVEFFFDVGSPTTYLAWTQLPHIAAAADAELICRPMLLGGVFQATGNASPAEVPAKGA